MKHTPLLLLPGMLSDSTMWQAQSDEFSRTREVVVGDLGKGSTSIATMATRVLSDAPERFALAGLSLGGIVAFEILRQAAQRVTRLCLMDCQAQPESPEAREKRLQLIAGTQQGGFPRILSTVVGQLLHPMHRDGPLANTVREMGERAGAQQFVDQLHAVMQRADSRPFLSAIKVPTLVICGAQDIMTPPHLAVAIAEGIEGSQLRIIEEAAHLPPMENPQAVNEAMGRWLGAE